VKIEFNEGEPLSEKSRLVLINHVIENTDKIEAIHNLDGFSDYLLRTLMNDECISCSLCKVNQGKCYGKIGGNPCLVFRPKEDKLYTT